MCDCLFDYLLITQSKKPLKNKGSEMEHTGFEPVASTMRMLRAPNCANAPCPYYSTRQIRKQAFFQMLAFLYFVKLLPLFGQRQVILRMGCQAFG